MYHANSNHRKAGVVTLIDETDFKTMTYMQNIQAKISDGNLQYLFTEMESNYSGI